VDLLGILVGISMPNSSSSAIASSTVSSDGTEVGPKAFHW
jgi:hypothetical protein